MKVYPVRLEVSGDLGMFARPDSGSEPISYPVPPESAAIGMLQSICRVRGAAIRPVAVAVCSMPRWTSHGYNTTTSPYRKSNLVKSNQGTIIMNMVLENPHFQILAIIENRIDDTPLNYKGVNCAHSFQSQFARRVKRGQSFYPVSLGCKEMLATQVSFANTPVEQKFNTVLPSFIYPVFGNGFVERIEAKQNVAIENGVLKYTAADQYPITIDENGYLNFEQEELRKGLTNVE